ncbi:MAG TPA: hypothetical protein PLM98_04580 [Thiolinea sp.]|nr:hypothetical protein [Thiolinea sp.]
MSITAKLILVLTCCSCLAACQESATVVAPSPTPTTTILPTKQTEQVVIDKLNAAQQVEQQRLDAAEKF